MSPGPRGRPHALDALIAPRETAFGSLHLVERSAEWRALSASSVAALALSADALDLSRPLFFDTETTGLHGGTGTVPFLLGIARVEGEACTVAQVHLPSPGAERPMLEWLSAQLAQATVLISFNGKSFDWPLLRARFVMNRLPPPRELPHVDLLHCARRVFKHHLDELTLASLERRVLGVHRRADIAGALIPAAWFDFLRTGRVAVLSRVLEHNERDVRSMVELVQRLVAAWEGRAALTPATALGLAEVAVRSGDAEKAKLFLAQAVAAPGEVGGAALSLKAELLRRKGEFAASLEVLLEAVHRAAAPAALHLRLAKLYEHRMSDPEAAKRHALLAGEVEAPERHVARLARLERKRVLKFPLL
ncbi:MAG: ribonuclease H-like domain-containing protein [Myxococcaceae bacterium]